MKISDNSQDFNEQKSTNNHQKSKIKNKLEIFTFGCRLNTAESEEIKNAITNYDTSNVAIFNSCAVTENAEKELATKIKQYKKKHPQA